MNVKDTALPKTIMSFYDNYVPSLKDGEYTITVSQELVVDTVQTQVDGGNANIQSPPHAPVIQKFIVRGPRFALNPSDIHHIFPPQNSTGDYDHFLPLIVFNKPELPWERELDFSSFPDQAYDTSLYPWLALLIFTNEELLIPEPASGNVSAPPDGSQKNPTVTASFPLNNIIHTRMGKPTDGPPPGTLGPTIKQLEDDEDPNRITCNVIEISADTFNALIPTINDLRFLAHVRQVSVENKALNNNIDGWFANVISNRLAIPPQDGALQRRNIVHLVSLEGLESYLGTDKPVSITGFRKVRLISLYSWTFNCHQDPQENFRELMLHLISANSIEDTDLLLRMPVAETPDVPDNLSYVTTYLQNGYVPLSYNIRTGEQTFAWYRGPLAPATTKNFLETTGSDAPDNPSIPLNASQAMIYNPATGLFDQSYAVAFQTGRSLALASKPFAVNLLQWRQDAHGIVDTLLEYMRSPHLKGILLKEGVIDANGNLTGAGISDLAQLLDVNIISAAFKDFLATDFYDTVAKNIGKNGGFNPDDEQQILNNATQPQPVVPADLNQLMQEPPVISLLHHLSGLASLGTTALPLSGNITSIPLQAPGASEVVKSTAKIAIVTPDGKNTVIVTTLLDIKPGDLQIPIENFCSQTPFPVGSIVQLKENSIMPQQILTWLARTALLYDVPFNNLVPDVRMLPQESIRFFYIDQNWIDCILDGALSIGIQSGRDSLFHQLMRDQLHSAVDTVQNQVRNKLRNVSSTQTPAPPGAPAGFILRSLVVSGWLGLEVIAYSAADNVNPMKPLRLDRVAPDIMIGIFPDIPVKLEFNEPSEGLVFGIEEQGVALRYLPGIQGATESNIGQLINPQEPIWLSPDDINKLKRSQPAIQPVLKISGSGSLVEALQNKFPGAKPDLGPAAFAVEMVCVPEQMLFESKQNEVEKRK